jgi:hypothetical protein
MYYSKQIYESQTPIMDPARRVRCLVSTITETELSLVGGITTSKIAHRMAFDMQFSFS